MDESCCLPTPLEQDPARCPVSGTPGRITPLVTLKALLTPSALATLEPDQTYRFCPDPTCEVVYYSPARAYRTADLKVPVYQKDPGDDVPLCYCFGWTRGALLHAWQMEEGHGVVREIRAHVQAGRCGCEVNNPQGSCCLGDVSRVLKTLDREHASS
ncbi:(2Fe-2S)-binding protein (plasmid) [Deinococcus aetherius]|uniref:(2Fe-2S)-binding protein n=1 Tax=Deinococcus aetherius TaxID=200252 RepID=A0ABN6RMA2_9DEIO|nr:(2Fe-2S)-binding protein [Deinococcus aetherius]BDP43999.1 (2Fe-2S)-binding protein [Deinococcus aetherius]